MNEIATLYRAQADRQGLRLRTWLPPGDCVVQADAHLLRQALINLTHNALRYTPRGGVLLGVRRRGAHWLIEVWDTGIGIPDHEQSQIYEEFYKVPTSGTEEGVGLGLAIVRRLSERLGNTVSLRSRAGRGTVFRVLVPPLPAPNPSLRNSAARSSGQSAGSASGS